MAQKLNSQPIQVWRNKIRLLASALVAVVLVPGLVAHLATENDNLAAPLREYLEKEIRLTKAEMDSVIADRPVAKLLKTKTKDEVTIFGIVRINAPQELFIEKLRDIVAFESGPGVQGIGLFHSPPVLSDVAALQIDNKELKEIPDCRVGDCSLKLSDRAMQSLREQIDWRSPKATSQAQSMIRQAIVDYVGNYQKIGDDALAVYNDQDKPPYHLCGRFKDVDCKPLLSSGTRGEKCGARFSITGLQVVLSCLSQRLLCGWTDGVQRCADSRNRRAEKSTITR